MACPMSELHKFLFEGLPVRGMLVRLTDSWQEALRRRETVGAFPAPVRVLSSVSTARYRLERLPSPYMLSHL